MNKKLNGMVGLKARDTISESTVEKCSYQQINFRCYSRFDGTTYGDRAFTGTGVMGVWKLDTKKKRTKTNNEIGNSHQAQYSFTYLKNGHFIILFCRLTI